MLHHLFREENDIKTTRSVIDHSGVLIGTATATGDAAYDHSKVRIGTVTATGDVVSHSCVCIGKVLAAA